MVRRHPFHATQLPEFKSNRDDDDTSDNDTCWGYRDQQSFLNAVFGSNENSDNEIDSSDCTHVENKIERIPNENDKIKQTVSASSMSHRNESLNCPAENSNQMSSSIKAEHMKDEDDYIIQLVDEDQIQAQNNKETYEKENN